MTTTPEAPKPSPASTPIKAPDDTLLKNFRATLEDGWNKFDSAVPAAGKSGMFASDDYAKVKAEYESAKQMLSLIKTDDQLRADIPMRQKLDETIKMLRKHNAESNKAEGYNKALVEMENNLAKLQIDVEKNNTTLPTVVPVATAVTAVAGGALATEAVSGLSGAIGEGMKDLGKEAATIKKNPIKKIAEFFGFSETSIVSDFKEALAEKKAGGFDGFFGGIKVWFYGFLAKMFGTDLAKHLTPEEMKLAGIKGKVETEVKPTQAGKENGNDEEKKKKEQERKYILAKMTFTKLLFSKEKEGAGALFEQPNFQKLTYGEIKKTYAEGKKDGIAKKMGLDPQKDSVVWDMFEAIGGGKISGYIAMEFAKKYPGKDMHKETVKDILIATADQFGAIVMLRNIDLSNPATFLEGMQFDIDDSGELVGPVAEKVKQHVSRETLGYMLIQGDTYKFINTKTNMEIERKKETPKLLENTLQEMQKIFDFGEKFREKLLGDPKLHLGYADSFKEKFEKPGMSYQFLVLLYGSLGGDADFHSMTPVGKLGFYSGIITLAGGLDSMDKGSVAAGFMKKLLTGDAPEIDPEVKKLGEDTGISLLGKVTDSVWETIKTVIGIGREWPTAAIAAIALMWFGGTARKQWHKFRMH